jgi:hypothetical protein
VSDTIKILNLVSDTELPMKKDPQLTIFPQILSYLHMIVEGKQDKKSSHKKISPPFDH